MGDSHYSLAEWWAGIEGRVFGVLEEFCAIGIEQWICQSFFAKITKLFDAIVS